MRISVNDIIMWIMAIGFVIGGLDYMAGDRMGLGKKFKEGIDFLGAATLSMAGLMCLVPEFSEGIKAILHRTGTGAIDPAMAASVIGINMGGHGADGKPPDRCILRHRRLFHAGCHHHLYYSHGVIYH